MHSYIERTSNRYTCATDSCERIGIRKFVPGMKGVGRHSASEEIKH